MSLMSRFTAAVCCSALVWITGCVGPMACGPDGSCGPIAFGTSCDGCGECEGCGELYLDPWINNPADCCDPCDQCGNFNGQSCGNCRSVFSGFRSLWGYRCDAGCDTGCDVGCGDCGDVGCDGGCGLAVAGCGSSCGGCDSCHGGISYGGTSELVRVIPEPTPAKRIVEAGPSEAPYTPHRTRKIFKARPNVASGPPQASDY